MCIRDSVETAHTKIRAFDVIGPAYVIHNDKNIKIHKYTNSNLGLEIKLNDGYIFPSEITPEGRNRMKVEDYIRGIKWKYRQVFWQLIKTILLTI